MSRQLAFDLPSGEAFRRADFFVSEANKQALTAVEAWRDWPEGKLLLVGPEGAGKTHLAHVWAEMAGAEVVSAAKLIDADLHDLAEGPVAIENADRIAGDAEAEVALFHLHNLLAGKGLLVTATTPPRDWGLRLPDLLSRMQAASVAQLDPPDDMLLSAVLIKLFADRQIVVAPNLISFLVSRMDRSFAAAREWVKFLDARALALGRPISRALAAEVLDLPDGR
ncbi:MAG: Chromosomal replication initiator DnaA [Cypionkella sp.]|uniref:chromosomal replication initiator DnaA n=1 Tax=Cypionkella sp. TaxID=2811411 RepID=UPI00260BBE2E|nr:chromosomal replication initiator DnaA [Cypionkella sp.]MDB5660071.1 Chromosomal replication initiator DnaA [Cypionkella sp.]MDB5664110.1 Chromosomal replication initiator DnaA [Cypionkella sp.]